MEVRHRLKLKRNTEKLLENLDAYYLLPYLCQEDIITQRVWDEIVATEPKTAHTRTTELLRRLPKCGPKAYEVFCTALDNNSYGFLREALDKTVITEDDIKNFESCEFHHVTEDGTVHVTQISENNFNTGNTPHQITNLAMPSGGRGQVTQISRGNINIGNYAGAQITGSLNIRQEIPTNNLSASWGTNNGADCQ